MDVGSDDQKGTRTVALGHSRDIGPNGKTEKCVYILKSGIFPNTQYFLSSIVVLFYLVLQNVFLFRPGCFEF